MHPHKLSFKPASTGLESLESRIVPTNWGYPWPTPEALTISFVPDGTAVGTQTSELFHVMDETQDSDWQTELLRAVQTWSAVSTIDFSFQHDSGDPLGISGLITGSSRYGTIRVAAYPMPTDVIGISIPFEPSGGTWAGDVVLNSNFLRDSNQVEDFDLYTVFLHETGNILGLADNNDPDSVMYAFYNGAHDGLAPQDVMAIQDLYGANPDDEHEGATGNERLNEATPVTLDAGSGSSAIFGIVSYSDDVDIYRFTAPDSLTGGNDGVTMHFELRTTGISLFTSQLTVADDQGRVLASCHAHHPQNGDYEIVLEGLQPGHDYFIQIEGDPQSELDPVFNVGEYGLVISRDGTPTESLDTLFFESVGYAYLIPLINDGMAFEGSDAMEIITSLFLPEGTDQELDPALINAVLDDYLESHGDKPFDTQAFGDFVGRLLNLPGGQFSIGPGSLTALFNVLDDRGLFVGVLSDLLNNEQIRSVFGEAFLASGDTTFLQQLFDAGALQGPIDLLLGTGTLDPLIGDLFGNPAFKAHIAELLQSDDSNETFAQVAQSSLGADIFDIFVQNPTIQTSMLNGLLSGQLDPLLSSLFHSGTLDGLLFMIWEQPVTQELFLQALDSGVLDPMIPVLIPPEYLSMIEGLDPSVARTIVRQVIDTSGTLPLDPGSLRTIVDELWDSGMVSQIIGHLVTTNQFEPMVGHFLKTDFQLDADSMKALIQVIVETPELLSLDGTAMRKIFQAIWTSDLDQDIQDMIWGSETLDGVFDSILESDQSDYIVDLMYETGIFTDLLKSVFEGTIEVPPEFVIQLMSLFIPDTQGQFSDAQELYSLNQAVKGSAEFRIGFGILADAETKSYHKVIAPDAESASRYDSLYVFAWNISGSSVQPVLRLFDDQGELVDFVITGNKDGSYLIEFGNYIPGSAYYVEVTHSQYHGSPKGDFYAVGSGFTPFSTQMTTLVEETFRPGNEMVVRSYQTPETEIVHWVLSADRIGDPEIPLDHDHLVQLDVMDQLGQLVHSTQIPLGGIINLDLFLEQGTYDLHFSLLDHEGNPDGASVDLENVSFQLRGLTMSDSINPYRKDTTLATTNQPIAPTTPDHSPSFDFNVQANAIMPNAVAGQLGVMTQTPISTAYWSGTEAPATSQTIEVAADGPVSLTTMASGTQGQGQTETNADPDQPASFSEDDPDKTIRLAQQDSQETPLSTKRLDEIASQLERLAEQVHPQQTDPARPDETIAPVPRVNANPMVAEAETETSSPIAPTIVPQAPPIIAAIFAPTMASDPDLNLIPVSEDVHIQRGVDAMLAQLPVREILAVLSIMVGVKAIEVIKSRTPERQSRTRPTRDPRERVLPTA